MKRRKRIWICIIMLFIVLLYTGCGQTESNKKPGPEIGKWHAEIELNDISDSMTEEDRLILAMLTGNIIFEVDVEFFEDGTYTYITNADKLEEAVLDSVNSLIGLFIDIDLSTFIQNLIEVAMKDSLPYINEEYEGTYSNTDNGLVAVFDGEKLYFKVSEHTLMQVDADGNEILKFSRVS